LCVCRVLDHETFTYNLTAANSTAATDAACHDDGAQLTSKRGGDNARAEINDFTAPLQDEELLHLDEALTRLALIKPDHAKLVELRCFAGMTNDEAAASLNISVATATRMMNYAKAWLKVEMDAP